MSRAVRAFPDLLGVAAAEQFNAFKRECAAGLAAAVVHADVTSKDDSSGTALAVAAANGDGTLATLLLLCADIKSVYETHLADATAHKIADPAPALVAATDLATSITLLNAIKADYNAHRASTTYHYAADGTNVTAAVDATNQATSDTLANEIKVDLNAHVLLGFATRSIKVVNS